MMTNTTQVQRIDLRTQHLQAGLDPKDMQYLDTPTNQPRPTIARFGNYCAPID